MLNEGGAQELLTLGENENEKRLVTSAEIHEFRMLGNLIGSIDER